MISELEEWGLVKKYKETYVLSRRGQMVFSKSGSNPYFWKKDPAQGMGEHEFLRLMLDLFGTNETFPIEDQSKIQNSFRWAVRA